MPSPWSWPWLPTAHAAAGVHHVLGELGVQGEDVLVVHEPPAGPRRAPAPGPPAPRLGVDLLVGREAAQLGVVVDVGVGVEVVLTEGPAVRHDERGGVHRLRARQELHRVLELGLDGERVLDAGVPVQDVGHLQLVVEPALGGGRETQLVGGHDHPLALLAVARHVHLQRLGVVVLRVALEDVLRVVQARDHLAGEDARPRGVDARPHHLAVGHLVLVGEHVRGRRLRVPGRRGAVRQLRQVLPRLRAVDLRDEPLGVVVGVDEARHDGLAAHVDDLRAVGDLHGPPGTHRLDAVVLDDDVAVLDDLVALHGDDARAAEHRHARGDVPLHGMAISWDSASKRAGFFAAPALSAGASAAARPSRCRRRPAPGPGRRRSGCCRWTSGPCVHPRSTPGTRRRQPRAAEPGTAPCSRPPARSCGVSPPIMGTVIVYSSWSRSTSAWSPFGAMSTSSARMGCLLPGTVLPVTFTIPRSSVPSQRNETSPSWPEYA